MYPKIRDPIITWLLTVFTGGIYVFYWVWRITNELNSAEEKKIFNIRLWAYIWAILFLLVIAGVVNVKYVDSPALILIAMLCLSGLSIYVQLTIGNYIKRKYKELNIKARYSNMISIILLWFVVNTGVPYMQYAINTIIEHERNRS